VVILLFFTLLAALNGRSHKPFALGFAIVGWVYFVLTFGSHFENVDSYLLTQRIVEWSGEALHVDPVDKANSMLPTPTFDSKALDGLGKYSVFKDIAHCFCTLILAAIGGVAAIRLQRKLPNSTNPKTNLDP
jgi:hypothetical protein